MGNSKYIYNSTKFTDYNVIQQRSNVWGGAFVIIQDPVLHKRIIQKDIYLRSHEEAKNFVNKYKELEKSDFYVITPVHVELAKDQGLCNFSQTVHVYSNPLLPNLQDKIRKNRQPLRQNQIWFILNELSHGLRLIHGRNYPHLWISPQTIFYNLNDNWFLQDMHYWRGDDYQNLIQYKLNSHEIVSNHLKENFNANVNSDLNELLEEDIYCFGYSVIFMMTMVEPIEARKNIEVHLERAQMNYSHRLLYLIRSMVTEAPERRMTLEKLKHRLKLQEDQIMKQEMAEFKKEKIRRKEAQTQIKQKTNRTNYQRQKTQTHKNIAVTMPQTPNILNNNFSPFGESNRKNLVYFSPPSHRNAFNTLMGGPIRQFRYNSPRK